MFNFLKIFSRHKKLSILFALVLAGLLVWFFFFRGQGEAPSYQTATVERGNIISSVSASGQISSSNIVSVTTQASGVVKQIFVTDGQMVEKGDKILEIELDSQGEQKNSSAWSSYQSAKNTLASAQITKYTLQRDMFTNWDKFKKLAESTTYQNADGSPRTDQRYLAEFNIAQDDWLAAEAKYKQQDSVIAQAQTALNNAWVSYQQTSPVVYAPSSGVINSFAVAEGSMVNSSLSSSSTVSTNSSSSQKLAVIQNESLPLATFNLSEVDVPKVKIGQKAIITIDSLPDKTFTGRLVSVDRVGSVTSNVTTYSTLIKFDSGVSEILPNMAASAKIILAVANNTLHIPASAVSTSNDTSYVRVLKNGQVIMTQVDTGFSNDTQVEIKSGVKEGDVVVTGTSTTSTGSRSGSVFGGFGGGGFRVR